jgi:hypothetical protein
MSSQFAVVNEIHLEEMFRCVLYDNGIIEIIWDAKLEMIEIHHLEHAQQSIGSIGNGNKMPVYMTIHEFLSVSNDGRAFASSPEGVKFTLANALLIDSLPKKILFNFYVKFNKPVAPTRGFTTKEDAFDWLLFKLNESTQEKI